MTRINCGIPPKELTDKHLLAEHREIKRVPNVVKSGRFSMKGQPTEFCLGTGHVKFFYDKLLYLYKRYLQIHHECKKRNFNVQNYKEAWDDIPVKMMNSYKPTHKDREIIRERIAERLK
jgi:hypothetical protein